MLSLHLFSIQPKDNNIAANQLSPNHFQTVPIFSAVRCSQTLSAAT